MSVDLSRFENVVDFFIDDDCRGLGEIPCVHWVSLHERFENKDGTVEVVPMMTILDGPTICAIYRQRYNREPPKHYTRPRRTKSKRSCNIV